MPPGYTFRSDLFHDLKNTPEWYWIVFGNLLALIPLGIAILVMWLPYQFYVAFGAPLAIFPDPALPNWAFWIIGAVVIVGSMMLHELIHGLALIALGYRAHFNYALVGYLYTTIERGQYLTRRDYVIMTLSPLIVMTLTGSILLLLLPPSLGQILLIALLLNAAASIGDLSVAGRALRCPSDALFTDEGGIKVYVPMADSIHNS